MLMCRRRLVVLSFMAEAFVVLWARLPGPSARAVTLRAFSPIPLRQPRTIVEPIVRCRVAVEREVGPVVSLQAVVRPLEFQRSRRSFQAERRPRDRQFQLVAH